MQTPYDHLVDSASSLDQESLQALIDDLQLMHNEREPEAKGEFLMIEDGEFADSPVSRQDLLEMAGRRLDKACAYDILGQPIFVEDGRWYVVNVEAEISEANPAWLKDRLQFLSDEIGTDQPEYPVIMAKLEELGDA